MSNETNREPRSSGATGYPVVVSHGGGTNSTALLIGMVRRGVRPDLIMFADTGGERPETYAFLAEFSAWLIAKGFPEITIVRANGDTLEEDCIRRATLPSVAFGFKTCSQRWKIAPQDAFLKRWEPARDTWRAQGRVVKLIGYDAGERRRAKDYDDDRFMLRYPLIEWGWDRAECVRVCKSEGFAPEKSSCFFCPSMRRWEVRRLAVRHPELAARALAMEAGSRAETVPGLGRSYAWGDLLAADAAQLDLFAETHDDIPCGCYDGGCTLPDNDQAEGRRQCVPNNHTTPSIGVLLKRLVMLRPVVMCWRPFVFIASTPLFLLASAWEALRVEFYSDDFVYRWREWFAVTLHPAFWRGYRSKREYEAEQHNAKLSDGGEVQNG